MAVEDVTLISTGELARRCGVFVRTLRYYDQIGLLTPARRGRGGHRFYDGADVRRLYRIRLLRRVGLTLAEIGRALDEPGWPLHSAMRTHLEMQDQQLAAGMVSRRRLERMVSAPAPDETSSTAAQRHRAAADLNARLRGRRGCAVVPSCASSDWVRARCFTTPTGAAFKRRSTQATG